MHNFWTLAASLQYTDTDLNTVSIDMERLCGRDYSPAPEWSVARYSFVDEMQNLQDTTGTVNKQTSSTGATPEKQGKAIAQTESPSARSRLTAMGRPIVIEVDANTLATNSLEEILCRATQDGRLPAMRHYELMIRLRFAQNIPRQQSLEQLVNVRLMAVAILSHSCSESDLSANLLPMEPNLVDRISKIIRVEFRAPVSIRSSGFAALEALAHHRSRLADVLTALGTSIPHGLLMSSFRDLLTKFQDETQANLVSADLVDAHINLLTYLCTTNVAGTMLCSAGLVQALFSSVLIEKEGALRVLVKILTLLDHLVYGFPQAFDIFCDSGGLRPLVNRIGSEVSLDLSAAYQFTAIKTVNKVDYAMSHERFSLLKTMLKFVVHMMQTTGTADGLRNLVETQLPTTMKVIYENLDVFGSSIFASTTNILATFIHNEPSSYQVLQELALPELFLKTVAREILPSADALSTIPNAFGAICLNTQGLAQFNQIAPLTKFVKVFLSKAHCEALQPVVAHALGKSMDELVRHQPSLKQSVLAGIRHVLDEINSIGFRTIDVSPNRCAITFLEEETDASLTTVDGQLATQSYTDDSRTLRPVVMLYIEVFAHFLRGFMQNNNIAREFLHQDESLAKLLSLNQLRTLPYDFPESSASKALNELLVSTYQHRPELYFLSSLDALNNYISASRSFVSTGFPESLFATLFRDEHMLRQIRPLLLNFREIHSLSTLLSLFCAQSDVRNAGPYHVYIKKDSSQERAIQSLGDFHRWVIRQEIDYMDSLPLAWRQALSPTPSDGKVITAEGSDEISKISDADHDSARFRDVKMVVFLLHETERTMSSLFGLFSKMLVVNRRRTTNVDYEKRLSAALVGRHLSDILLQHLSSLGRLTVENSTRWQYQCKILQLTDVMLHGSKAPLYECWTFTNLLIDLNGQISTNVLYSFIDNLDILNTFLRTIWDHIKGSIRTAEQGIHDPMPSHVYDMLKLILRSFERFTDANLVLNAPQTMLLDSKGKHKDRSDSFYPDEFLRGIRSRIMSYCVDIWYDPQLHRMPPLSLSFLMNIINHCIEASSDGPLQADPNASINYFSTVSAPKFSEAALARHTDRHTRGNSSECHIESLSGCFREIIRQDSVHQALRILRFAPQAVFDLADLIVCSVNSSTHPDWTADVIEYMLINIRNSKVEEEGSQQLTQFATTTHLLAKVIHNAKFLANCFDGVKNKSSVEDGIVEIINECVDEQRAELNKGACNLLVSWDRLDSRNGSVVEHLIREVTMDATMTSIIPDHEQQLAVYNHVLKLIRSASDKGSLLSLMRFIARITSIPRFYPYLQHGSLVSVLLRQLRQHINQCDENVMTTLIVALRHLVENRALLDSFVSNEIRRWFNSKFRNVDVSSFVKQNVNLALRCPMVFVKCTEALCHFPDYDSSTELQAISLRHKPDEKVKNTGGTTTSDTVSSSNVKDSSPVSTADSYNDQTMVFLLEEFCNLTESDQLLTRQPETTADSTDLDKSRRLYRLILLQCIRELLSSYGPCKRDFITDKLRIVKAGVEITTNALQVFVEMFLDEHVLDLGSKDTSGSQKPSVMQLLREVIVALFVQVGFDDGSDFLQIQQVAVDTLQRLFSATLASALAPNGKETLASRRGRTLAFADLINSLLTAADVLNRQYLQPDNAGQTSIEVAKLMLERHFVSFLTQALSTIAYSSSSTAHEVTMILRPLRCLTKLSVRFAQDAVMLAPKADTPHESTLEQQQQDDTQLELDEDSDSEREETPDLYRNSALGIFGPEMHESDNESYTSDEDDEM